MNCEYLQVRDGFEERWLNSFDVAVVADETG